MPTLEALKDREPVPSLLGLTDTEKPSLVMEMKGSDTMPTLLTLEGIAFNPGSDR